MMNVHAPPVALGTGIFTVSDIARFTRCSPAAVRRWILGNSSGKPVIEQPHAVVDGEPTLTFADLITALFVREFRERGVSLQHIRRAGTIAAAELGRPNPFVVRGFATDGREIFLRVGESKQDAKLLAICSRQAAFEKVLEPFLSTVDFDGDIAARWRPLGKRKPVVVDPAVAFGEPTVHGVPTRVLAGPVRAGDSPADVARWYGVRPAEVLAAVKFEEQIAARAA